MKAKWTAGLAGLLFCLGSSMAPAYASDVFETVQVSDRVYALVGELTQRSPDNLGNNMTGGFIIADDGVVVVDTGGSRAGAEAIAQAVQEVTDKPIVWAINSGGQDHRWLGNDYFLSVVGAQIIAAEEGLQDMQNRTYQQMSMSERNLGEAFAGTEAAYPNVTFNDRHVLPVEGVVIELLYSGGAHTPADIFVWLPEEGIVFAGDVVFAERLLGIQPNMGLRWIAALERMRDEIKPKIVIPGHGAPTTLDAALKDSLDYLVMLRDGTLQAIEDGAFDPFEVAENLDQSAFSYLENYEDVRFRKSNAMRMAEELFALE